MKKRKDKNTNSSPNLSDDKPGAPVEDTSSAAILPGPQEHTAKVSSNKRLYFVAIGVILAAAGLAGLFGSRKKANAPEAKLAVPIERGESINAPEPQRSDAVVTRSSLSAGRDPILDGIEQNPTAFGGNLAQEIAQPTNYSPTAQAIFSKSANQTTNLNEEARKKLEVEDNLKLMKLEQAASGARSNQVNGPLPRIGEYWLASFNLLSSFPFETKQEMFLPGENSAAATVAISEQIPEKIKALNEKPVAAQGFMIPVKGNFGEWTEFLLVKNRANCCYGQTPKPNEWMMVRTAGKGVEYIKDEVVTVFGTFRVGNIREQGSFAGIYEMDCDKVELAK